MKYLILGASAAGLSAAETIRRYDPTGDITVLSLDRSIYSRCLLPDLLAGRRNAAAARFVPVDFMERHSIRWVGGVGAEKLLAAERTVISDTGDRFCYDRLLIATGASPFLPPIDNIRQGRQVYGLRNIEDVQSIAGAASGCSSAVVMGGGLVGVDAAAALCEKGLSVVIVEVAEHILPLQLDMRAAVRYQELLRSRGVEIITGQTVSSILLDEDQNVTAVRLKGGGTISCGMVVSAAGVRPNISFLEGTAVEVGRGIRVNRFQQTSLENIYAAGDVCESLESFSGRISLTPVWPLAVRQGRVAGANMAGVRQKIINNFAYKNSMHLYGLASISYGIPEAPDDSYETYIEERRGSYKKLIIKDGFLRGAIFQGDIAGAGVVGTLISEGVPITACKENLFDLNFAHFFNQRENGEFVFN
ncbi:MAG: NAD(P)/FAD-dependent oxidoreductase [Bacillota bacterium]